jgi:hypothetical protein
MPILDIKFFLKKKQKTLPSHLFVSNITYLIYSRTLQSNTLFQSHGHHPNKPPSASGKKKKKHRSSSMQPSLTTIPFSFPFNKCSITTNLYRATWLWFLEQFFAPLGTLI